MGRALVFVALVAVAAAASAGVARAAARACEPGTLELSVPYLPAGLAITPNGEDLILVDRGALTVRDPATLAVKRTLLPTMDRWGRAYVSADGALVWAETVDGLRFTFDTATWRAKRLADDRSTSPGAARRNEESLWNELRYAGTDALSRHEASFWEMHQPRLGLPPLPAGVQASAVTHGIVRTRGGKAVLDPFEPIAPGDDPSLFRLVVADTGGTLRIYDDTKELVASRVLAGARVVRLDISGQRILAALATGEVVLLDQQLVVETRAPVLSPVPVLSTPGLQRALNIPAGPDRPHHGIMSMQYDPARRRLAWVSTDHAVGTYGFGTGRTLARIAGTGEALKDALFLDERRVALLTDEGISIRDIGDGKVLKERRGAYRTMIAAGGGLLAIGSDGGGDVVDATTLSVRRRVCFLVQGCAPPALPRPEGVAAEAWNQLPPETKQSMLEMLMPADERRFKAAAKQTFSALSPDGRTLAVLQPPLESEARKSPGALTVWDTRTLSRRRRVDIKDCNNWKVAFAGARMLDVCGNQRRDTTTLAPSAHDLDRNRYRADARRRGEHPERTPVGQVAIEVWPSPRGDVVTVVGQKGEALLDIARPESKANPPELKAPDQERAQLRTQTLAVAAPGGRRFLLAGRGLNGDALLPGLTEASGPLQVWCTPTRPVPDGGLPLPLEPATAEIDGVTEVALDRLPEKILGAAEVRGEALVLGTDLKGEARTLISVARRDRERDRDGNRDATSQTLPPGGPWDRVLPSPDGETAWLESKTAVARRNRDGTWTTFPLDLTSPQASTQFFAPLTAETAVHVTRRVCTAAEQASSKAEPNLRAYYTHNRSRFLVPRRLEGSKIELLADAETPADQQAQQSLRRRTEAVATLLAAPGATFAEVQGRAVKDPKINASPGLRLWLVEGPLSESDRPLTRLFSARPGEVVGPISSKITDPYGRPHERLLARFVRVDKIEPERVHPFSDLVAVAGGWHPFSESSGECADVAVLGTSRPERRTVLPPHAARTFLAWKGGFAAVGNPLLVYRDGAWVSPASPLASTIAALRGDDTLAAGGNLYVRRPGQIAILDAATAKPLRTVAIGEHESPKAVQARPEGGEAILIVNPNDMGGVVLAVDAAGRRAAHLGPSRPPRWASLSGAATLTPGRTARFWTTDVALMRRDGDRWTALFNPAARRRGLDLRRRLESE